MAAQFTRNAWEAEELGLPTVAVVVLSKPNAEGLLGTLEVL
jgi:hypothetical protein